MQQCILVPLDGSARDEGTIPLVVRLARATNHTIILLRVISTATEFWPAIDNPYPQSTQAIVAAEFEDAEYYLSQLSQQPEFADIRVKTIVRYGAIAPTILSVAREHPITLTVMSKHEHRNTPRRLSKNIIEIVANHAITPVLVLQDSSRWAPRHYGDAYQPLRILVPLDGSVDAETALTVSGHFLATCTDITSKLALHLLGVVSPPIHRLEDDDTTYNERYAEALGQMGSYLQTTARELYSGQRVPEIARYQVGITWSVALDSDIAGAIVNTAEMGEDYEGAGTFGGCDIIVMTTHGWDSFYLRSLGSITEQVLHRTHKPVIVTHPTVSIEKTMAFYRPETRPTNQL